MIRAIIMFFHGCRMRVFMLGASSPPEIQENQSQSPEEGLSLEAQFTRAQARVSHHASSQYPQRPHVPSCQAACQSLADRCCSVSGFVNFHSQAFAACRHRHGIACLLSSVLCGSTLQTSTMQVWSRESFSCDI